MAGEKVREAIADLRRRGTDRLDDLIGILRRGPAAVAELALEAEDGQFDNRLHALVRANGQRFAVTVASLPNAVRRHPFIIELLAALGGQTLATAALTAWDEGRHGEAAFLADATNDRASGEASIMAARRAAADREPAAASAAYGQALTRPLAPALAIEAARALHAAGEVAKALVALAAVPADAPTRPADAALTELVAHGCLNGDRATLDWLTALPAAHLERLREGVVAEAAAVGWQLLEGVRVSLSGLRAATDRLTEAFRADVLSPQREAVVSAATEAQLATLAAVALVSAAPDGALAHPGGAMPGLARLLDECRSAADRLGAVRAPLRIDLEHLSAAFVTVTDDPPAPTAGLRLTRQMTARLAECQAALAVATANGRPVTQRLADLPAEVEREVRAPLGDQGIMVRGEGRDVPGVACDRGRLVWALATLAQSMANGQPTRQVTLGIDFAPAEDVVVFTIRTQAAPATSTGDGGRGVAPAGFPAAVVASVVAECAGQLAITSDAAGAEARVSLPVSAAEAELARLAGISNEARMALRAAEGMVADGNAEMAAFLAERAVLAEAAQRLKPLLVRHALLPRALWVLGAPAQLRAGLPATAAGLPPLAGRRVEELCRLVTADRLSKRLTSLSDYADTVRLFGLSHPGWPEHGGVQGLSQTAAERLVASCLTTASAIAAGGGDAVAAARQTLAALLACGGKDQD